MLTGVAAMGASAADFRDIEYSRPGGFRLALDAFTPDQPGPHPTVIFVHGGGFAKGDRKGVTSTVFGQLRNEGYVVLSIDYRLAPEFRFPAPSDDVESAIRWAISNSGKYGIDTGRLALAGTSAGGQLVSYAAGTAGRKLGVRAVVSMYATHELLERAKRDGSISPGICALLGTDPAITPDKFALLRKISPYYYAYKEMPPMLLVHGKVDQTVPYQQSVDMYQHLQKLGADTDLFLVEGGGHGGWDKLPQAAEYQSYVKDWLKRKLQ